MFRIQSAARPRRMSFNDRHALETLPARIEVLQTKIARLNAILANPDLYSRDPRRFGATTQALAAARDELTAAEEQWLTLEMHTPIQKSSAIREFRSAPSISSRSTGARSACVILDK